MGGHLVQECQRYSLWAIYGPWRGIFWSQVLPLGTESTHTPHTERADQPHTYGPGCMPHIVPPLWQAWDLRCMQVPSPLGPGHASHTVLALPSPRCILHTASSLAGLGLLLHFFLPHCSGVGTAYSSGPRLTRGMLHVATCGSHMKPLPAPICSALLDWPEQWVGVACGLFIWLVDWPGTIH